MRPLINLSLLRRNPKFRLLYTGRFISFMGTMVASVALPYQIYHITQSTMMVGLLSLFQLLPLLFTALLGGVFADRYHRRVLLVIAEISLACGSLLLAGNALFATPRIWIIFVVAPLMSAFNGFHRPAFNSVVQQLVAKKDYAEIGPLNTFTFSLCAIAGPAVGGLLIAHLGVLVTFLVDSASFMASLSAILLIGNVPRLKERRDESTWSALKEGFHYAFSKQELLGTYAVDFLAMVFGMPMALFPAMAESYGGVKTLGMLYSAPAVGALIISLFSGWTLHIKRHGAAVAIAASCWGIAIIFFGIFRAHLCIALIFLAFAGGFDAVSGMFRNIMWNESVSHEFRGRLAGIEMLSYLSGPKLGDTEAGLVAAAFGVSASIISGGVLCVITVAASCYFLPRFWRYRSKVSNERKSA
ncbi:MAG: MFS transporter [Gammaproteobacteria bacterium GWE2_42_36]|nr:MAG: MFS transporter [Gammaproteobacteria bacterium GWE2_42_36]HCU05401.1 MFS transporter [Coxiellaceae bacterium]